MLGGPGWTWLDAAILTRSQSSGASDCGAKLGLRVGGMPTADWGGEQVSTVILCLRRVFT